MLKPKHLAVTPSSANYCVQYLYVLFVLQFVHVKETVNMSTCTICYKWSLSVSLQYMEVEQETENNSEQKCLE